MDDFGAVRPVRAVLLALIDEPRPVSAIAARAGLAHEEAREALQQLVADSVAIEEDANYELTGPLSWFGSFAAAAKYHARKNFIVTAHGDADSHLYVDDVRVKGRVRAGDPSNETLSIFACGTVAVDVALASGQTRPTCATCANFAQSS
jgi:hypothetical protein